MSGFLLGFAVAIFVQLVFGLTLAADGDVWWFLEDHVGADISVFCYSLARVVLPLYSAKRHSRFWSCGNDAHSSLKYVLVVDLTLLGVKG
ncbi:hypothetical protein U1Q18_019876 [Sarracenia purpurea var. burkii]